MQRKIYGYWVSNTDEIYETGYIQHAEKAIEIIKSRYGKDIGNSEWSPHRYMFTLGFIRVVYDSRTNGDEYSVQYSTRTKLSKLQKQFIKDAKITETDTIIY